MKTSILRKLILIIIFIPGLLFFAIPVFRGIVNSMVPVILLISAITLLWGHKPWNRDVIMMMALIFALGFAIEVLGVKTGIIFGYYHYTGKLGIELFNVPILLGLLWLVLIYCVKIIVNQFGQHPLLKHLAGALILTLTDFILEPVASLLNWWYWHSGIAPLQNYIAWYIFSFFLLLMADQSFKNSKNDVAVTYFILLIVFLTGLNIIL